MRVDGNVTMLRDTHEKKVEDKHESREIRDTERVAHEDNRKDIKVEREVKVDLPKRVSTVSDNKTIEADKTETKIKSDTAAKEAVKKIESELKSKPDTAITAQANSKTDDVLFLLQGA